MNKELKNKQPLILIVDDVTANVKVLGNILLEEDFQIIVARNGLQAIEMAKNTKPDLILLDVNMPEMDGYETCKRLKSDLTTSFIPVIFLTAFNDTQNIVKGFEAGGVDYITKPYQKKELLLRVNTHLELKFSREKLEKLIATKDMFFSIIAHDLRGPIGALTLLLEILTETNNPLSDKAVSDILNQLKDSSKATSWLLDNLLKWARSQKREVTFNPSFISLYDVVKVNMNLFTQLANNKQIELINGVDINVKANFDFDMINTVVRNLLNNAIKFSLKGGKITVITTEYNNNIEVCIADTGVGIKSQIAENLFRSDVKIITQQGTSGERGSGLGLILCKDFVEKHGGEIWVESEIDKGSKFKFTLPKSL